MTWAPNALKHTIDDWLAQPEEARLELIDGELVEKALPTPEHANAQGAAVEGRCTSPSPRRVSSAAAPGV